MGQRGKSLLRPVCVRAHLLVFLLQETRSRDVENLSWLCFFYRYKFGLTTLVVSDRFAKYRDHGDLRRDVLQCSVDRRSSWPFPRQTLAKTWRSTRSRWRRGRKICMKVVEQGANPSTSQVILTTSEDCCVQATATPESSARCMCFNVGRVAILTQVSLRNCCAPTL